MTAAAPWRVALSCGAFAACAALAPHHLWLVGLAAASGCLVVVVTFVDRRLVTACALIVAAAFGSWRGLSAAVVDEGPGSVAAHIGGGAVVLRGVVSDSGVPGRDDAVVVNASALATGAGSWTVSGAVVVQPLGAAPVLPGDAVEVQTAGLRAPASRPGALSMAALERVGASAIAPAARLTLLAAGAPTPARMAHQLRALLAGAAAAALPEPEATLLLGIAFGVHGRLSGTVRTSLQDAGLIHIVAVSGLKVVMVAGLVGALARARAWPRRRHVTVSLASLAVYVLLSGAGPAALRSSLTVGAGLLLARDGRRAHSFAMLGLAAALQVGVEPRVAADVGFQLSFLGTAGILVLAGPIAARLPGPRVLAEPFAVTVAAQLATAPITAGTFGVLPLIGPVANALALPLLPLGIVAGGVGTLLSTVSSGLGWLPLQVGALVARSVLAVAEGAAVLPFAAVHIPLWPSAWLIAELATIGTAVVLWVVHDRRRPWSPRTAPAVIICAALGAGVGSLGLAGALQPAGMRVTVLDVGNGVAVLVRPPGGGAVLVDGGADGAALLTALGRVMSPLDRRLDAVVLTATDRSSSSALASLPGHYDVGALVVSQPLPAALQAVAATMAGAGTTVFVAGERPWSVAGLVARCLPAGPARSVPCALQLTDRTTGVLVTGNLAQAAQDELASTNTGWLRADLLVAPTTTAPSAALLAATRSRSVAVPARRIPPGLGGVVGSVLVTGRDSDLEYSEGVDGALTGGDAAGP